jgi:type IV pilus assembly protein PilY1
VAFIRATESAGGHFLSISIGSGWREHPLDQVVQDRFYMLKDRYVLTTPASYTAVTETDLYDATDNVILEGSAEEREQALADLTEADGWYIRLTNTGEKVLAESVTVNNQVLFTTFQPGALSGQCSATDGIGRAYAVKVMDATPAIDMNEDNELTEIDRFEELNHSGIPPEPAVILPSEGKPIVLIGPEQALGELEFGDLIRPTYWKHITD